MLPFDFPEIHKIINRVSAIKLNSSIFGKVIQAVLGVVMCITLLASLTIVVLSSYGYNSLNVAVAVLCICGSTIILAVGLLIFVFIRLMRFAEKYPYVAAFNGGQLLLHERLVHAKDKADSVESIMLADTPVLQFPDTNDSESEVEHG